MKYLKISLFLSLIFFACINLGAQEADRGQPEEKEEQCKHGIGGVLGEATGKYLAYRHVLGDLTFQLAFYPVVDNDDFKSKAEVITSLSFFYRLSESEHLDLFLYQANQHRYFNGYFYGDGGYFYDSEMSDRIYNDQHYYDSGLGLGFQIKMDNGLIFNVMTGYTVLENFNKMKLTKEFSLFYMF
ncbi:MAG: hypothetical protein R6V32_11965 [Bacteroidales bacterium]